MKHTKKTTIMNPGRIKKGDQVQILSGKDNGKSGKVLQVIGKEGMVLVEGINVFKKHVKKTEGREGGIIDISKPLNVSRVMMLCPNCKKATRVGFSFNGDVKIRICKKCKETIK